MHLVKRVLSQQATARVHPPPSQPDFPPAKRLHPHEVSSLRTNTMPFRGRGLSKRPTSPRRSSRPKTILNGPFHDHDFILQQYFKSGVDLKHHEKEAPKSPLHNFYALVKNGQQPRYEFTSGSYSKGDKLIDVCRYVCSSSPIPLSD